MALDFSSSLYLGMRHLPQELPAWKSLTTGSPAILNEPALNKQLAQQLAVLQGMEAGVLVPSTLHGLFDFFSAVDRKSVLFIDEQVYPLMDWASRIATGRGIRVIPFPAQQVNRLATLIYMHVLPGQVPFILCDGWNPTTGLAAPLRKYLELLRPWRGYLFVDDTQALGILGAQPNDRQPLGFGGGGTLAWMGITSPSVISICSLAKGLGAPLAVMSGAKSFILPFEQKSLSRIHCSQVSNPIAGAAWRALQINQREGDQRRAQLISLIHTFQATVQRAGFQLKGGIFPVQTLELPSTEQALALYKHLQQYGIKALLLRGEGSLQVPLICFCISITQTPREYTFLQQCLKAFKITIQSSGYANAEPIHRHTF